MKKTFTQALAALLLTTLGLFTAQSSKAQSDEVDIVGYTNMYIRVKAAPQGGGKVFPFYQEATQKVWRDEWDFKQPIPVGSMMDAYFTMFYLYANPNTAEGYIFGGWYVDDGDGVFDIEKDELLSNDESFLWMGTLDDDATVYDTQQQARNGVFPSEPTDLVFACFTRGARVDLSFYQDDYLLHANCGTVVISNPINEPGDEVTVRAIPNDGFHFEYWQDAEEMGNIVSRENPYTFTVQGGEHLFAYFAADDAPEFDLPEEGGFVVTMTDKPWVPTEESVKNGAMVLVMEQEDLVRTDDDKAYLDMGNEEAQINVTQWLGAPTLIYGKGKVRFAYKMQYGVARKSDGLVKWSGDNGTSVSGDVMYVYAFIEELGAFVQIGTTDEFNEDATQKVSVPARVAYFALSAFDLTDDNGNIPTVIGLSPETYDRGVQGRDSALQKLASIAGVTINPNELNGQRVYTLSGVQVKTTAEKGVYIVNGKKVVLK